MSPEEVIAASDFMNMTSTIFIENYAVKELDGTFESKQNVPWIMLADKTTVIGPACIFLDTETNHCQIYQARPIQCSTYPFWSDIMESEYNWNIEARRADDDMSSALPTWTAEEGGCEGMKILGEENTSSGSNGVSINIALEQLTLFEQADRLAPEEVKYEYD
jgi:Fe-S-cluster containining protein